MRSARQRLAELHTKRYLLFQRIVTFRTDQENLSFAERGNWMYGSRRESEPDLICQGDPMNQEGL